jgi:hypothetical protein
LVAVIVTIHLKLDATSERAFLDCTESGGQLIPRHHSISSGKRKNRIGSSSSAWACRKAM